MRCWSEAIHWGLVRSKALEGRPLWVLAWHFAGLASNEMPGVISMRKIRATTRVARTMWGWFEPWGRKRGLATAALRLLELVPVFSQGMAGLVFAEMPGFAAGWNESPRWGCCRMLRGIRFLIVVPVLGRRCALPQAGMKRPVGAAGPCEEEEVFFLDPNRL